MATPPSSQPALSRADRVRALLAGRLVAPPPRDAATVLLLRDGVGRPGVEVFLIRRMASMSFAAGMYAFPGGAVDERDRDADVAWVGPSPAWWAERLGCAERGARGYLCAAVRETFEETGVLLAGDERGRVVGDTTGATWEAERRALLARATTLADVCRRHGLALHSDLLAPWAHWVTPQVEERRYDTWFFVARLPEGVRARNLSGEADVARWRSPAVAVAQHERGAWAMLPPTRAVLSEVAGYPDTVSLLAAAPGRPLPRVMPWAVLDGEAIRYLLPGDPGYPPSDGDSVANRPECPA